MFLWMFMDKSAFLHATFQVLAQTTTWAVLDKEWSSAAFKDQLIRLNRSIMKKCGIQESYI